MNAFGRFLVFAFSTFLLVGYFLQSVGALESSSDSELDGLIEKLFLAESVSKQQTIIAENQRLISPQLVEGLINKANPVRVTGNLDKCESINRMALGLAQRINFPKGIAAATNYLGVIYRKTRYYDLALGCFNNSFNIYQALGDKRGLSQTHRFFGRLYFDQQIFHKAFEHYSKDLLLANEFGDPYFIALARYNLGIAYEELGQYERASEEYKMSLEYSRSVKNVPPDGDLIGLIGDILERAGRNNFADWRYEESVFYYQQAVDFATEHPDIVPLSPMLNALAYSHLHNGNPVAALAAARKSQTIGKGTLLANAYYSEALIQSFSGNHTEALEAIEKAKAIIENPRFNSAARNVYLIEGLVNYRAGRPQRSYEALEKSILLTEKLRASIPVSKEAGPISFGSKYGPYSWMIALLASQDRKEEALNYSEWVKSRSLFNLMNNPAEAVEFFAAKSNLEERNLIVSELLKLNMQIAVEEFGSLPNDLKAKELRSQFQKNKDTLKMLRDDVVSKAEEAAANWPKEHALKQSDYQKLVADDQTALLQFVVRDNQTFLFALTKTGAKTDLQLYEMAIKRPEIREGVKRLRNLIINQDLSNELDRTAREWHDKLLGKAEAQLKNRRKIIIVPDDSLWDLPFMALKMTDGKYLAEQHAVSFAPSFNILLKMKSALASAKTAAPTRSLLAIGNPALSASKSMVPPGGLMGEELGDLPAAVRQVNQIRKFYGSRNSTVLIHENATEERFKQLAPKYRILHLAAHGLYNDLEPMRSSIVLSQINQSGKEDGLLEARELSMLKLNAEMVILSACETGRGQIRNGEGIIGLPWALFVAGCPTTIVSQWKVKSESTADLMVAMYANLNQKSKHLSKAEALQEAAKSMINGSNATYRHPFYWAGFAVFGKAD